MRYDNNTETFVSYYNVTKDVQILLRNVDQFEDVLSRVLLAGANHIYDIDFSTSELRKHRDATRALAMKVAQEKATDLAASRLAEPPLVTFQDKTQPSCQETTH